MFVAWVRPPVDTISFLLYSLSEYLVVMNLLDTTVRFGLGLAYSSSPTSRQLPVENRNGDTTLQNVYSTHYATHKQGKELRRGGTLLVVTT